MNEKKSFYEIVVEKLAGKWCNGLVMVDTSADEIAVSNIFCVNGEEISINHYSIPMNEKIFSKVIEMNYEEAIVALNVNNKSIISPKVYDRILTFDEYKDINYGGNVYSHTQDNEIIVNDKHQFTNFNEILSLGYISEKEKNENWLVF